jgi:hypothetical protein
MKVTPSNLRQHFMTACIFSLVCEGDIIIFRGDVCHCGSAYQKKNVRLHLHFTVKGTELPDDNFFPATQWREFVKQKIRKEKVVRSKSIVLKGKLRRERNQTKYAANLIKARLSRHTGYTACK